MKDAFEVDAKANVRITNDGYLTAMPRLARTGIQNYRGWELGLTDKRRDQVLRIYRSEEQVFDKMSLASFAHKPVTDDHPPGKVTSGIWKEHACGQLGDEVTRDGEFVRVPMVLMDQALISKVQAGKAQLSVGYDCDVDLTAGKTPSGEAYDGTQTGIAVNHVAVVDMARGGPQLRIGDTHQSPAALHRPGFVQMSDAERTAKEQAIADREASLSSRWQTPVAADAAPIQKPAPTSSQMSPAEQRDARLRDAWRA
ncbi:MAG TPA: DUF2213 domain-containing protein [Bradyrhizobium sp.]|nr:DUF2213 domain-containing protein [Bradyrhizobium sp.]